jgi:hypothetical protein
VETERVRWEPEDEGEYEAASAELQARFTRWAMRGGVFDGDLPAGLLHYKWAYVDQHLTRWRRRDLYEIYLELYPAKVMAEADGLDAILAETKAFITFLAETELLDEGSESSDILNDYLDQIAPEFRAHMADSSRYSFGKRLWTEAAIEGVSPDDPAAVEAFMGRFNARPRAERDAVLGRGVIHSGGRAATGRTTPPGTPPRSPGKRRKRRH